MDMKKENGYFMEDKDTLQLTHNLIFGDKNNSQNVSNKMSKSILLYGLGLGIATAVLCLLMLYAH
tara:strand:+ start:280 stop:474 length:195 start_codon:yes stop_codon:yes gene_type:complete